MRNDPKIIRAWCMYDWANSVYNLTITSSIFPAYYQAVTSNAQGDSITIFEYSLQNTVLYTYALSIAFLCVVLIGPLLGGVADYFGKKKLFMQAFCLIGSSGCMGMYFFTKENPLWGISMLILATIGYAGSLVFYNAFLPEITTPDQTDKVSAKGFSYGYIGSVILLIFNLSMVLKPTWYGLCPTGDCDMPARISFLSVGIWWMGFSQYSLWYLPATKGNKALGANYLLSGFRELRKVAKQVSALPKLLYFLIACFLYSMGAQTVMYVATLFGEKEFKLETGQLIAVVLVLQLIAIPGANAAAWLSKKWGNVSGLSAVVIVWILICLLAYFMQNAQHFYMIAVLVGLVMGGIQALSRSTYSKLIPANTQDNASFFSFYEVTEKLAIVFGTFTYGLIQHLTGSMRNSVVALGLFFVLGLVFLYLTSQYKSEKHEVHPFL